MTRKITTRPMILVILDGWGYRPETEFNAIAAARKPVWDALLANHPHTLINASGAEVGLPTAQMGNSEVGHLNLGAGRVVYQEFTRISRAIKTGSFFENKTLTGAIDGAIETGKAVHIMGLLSPGGVHSHEDHILAMLELAARRGATRFYVHAFLDGRDTPPKSAEASLRRLQDKIDELGAGRIASFVGRYYAMDRDHRWPRIQAAWKLITRGIADFTATSALEGLRRAYERDETDEFVQPTAIIPEGGEPVRMEDGDTVVFMNFRSDRARQITRPFVEEDFEGFEREYVPKLASFVCLTAYNSKFDTPVAFPSEKLHNVFGEFLSSLGLRQLRLAETEKYAHVTFFFNGGDEKPFEGEDRILVPSPNVATYDEQPEMSAYEVTDELIAAIGSRKYDNIVCNFANPDMVGHTGNFDAAVKAIEAIDECLGRILDAVGEHGGEILITADHGNAELMADRDTGQAHTAHTNFLVPLIFVGRPGARMMDSGILSDVAPTMLHLMGLEQPGEMSGRPLVTFEDAVEEAAG